MVSTAATGRNKLVFAAVYGILVSLLIVGSNVGAVTDYAGVQPSLMTRDGHLVLVAGDGRNITLQTSGEGCVNLNGENLLLVAKMARNASEVVERLRSTQLAAIEHTVLGLAAAVDGPRGLKRRMSMVEEGMLNGTGGARGPLAALRGRVTALTRRVFTVERQVRDLRSLLTTNECSSNPCNNGGTCEDHFNTYFCRCPDAWEGPTCSKDVNECSHFLGTDLGCQNGATCINKPGTYQCTCPDGWFGVHCTQRSNDCSKASARDLCENGICVSQSGASGFTCICNQGWTADPVTKACTVDVDECTSSSPPCSRNPPVACRNIPGSFLCESCPPGYTGNGFYCNDIDECQTNNGGCAPNVACTNTIGSRVCSNCPPGYQGNGVTCVYMGGACATNNGGCHPSATCQDNTAISGSYVSCTCRPGFVGSGIGPGGCVPGGYTAVNPCQSNPCRRGSCLSLGTLHRCVCPPGFTGVDCNTELDVCGSAPCQNGGTCVRLRSGDVYCNCSAGFQGPRCAEQKQACGGVLRDASGTLKFPVTNTLTKYVTNLSCGWMILVNTSLVVNVTFKSFHLEQSPDCSYDWLQIHDGRSAGDQLIGRYCGRTLPNNGNIVSTTNALYIWFRSDNSINGDGFEMQWDSVSPACGGVLETTSHGTISSPGSPGKYPPNRDCYWVISAPRTKRIQIQFFTLMIEAHQNCSNDFLAIHDGHLPQDPLLKKYCNTSRPAPLVTPGRNALLHFHSDASGSDTGFQLTYTVVAGFPGCGGILTAPQGDIVSPRDPGSDRYKNAIDCEWVIQQANNERIKITFVSFEVEESRTCSFDYLDIREGSDENAPLVNRYCGKTIPRSYDSIGNVLYIRFRTDWSLAHGGFHIKYIAICGGDFDTPEGIITSPFYPNPYPDSRTCIYRIRQPIGKAIKLHFLDFEVEDNAYPTCNFDNLEIRDGDNENSTLLGKYCGGPEKTPPDVMSTYNYMWLQFNTDSHVRNRGFKANYSTIDTLCGGIMRGSHGLITSPLHPETYPHDISCSWVIVADAGKIIQLSFVTFSLENHPSCRRDYVMVMDNSSVPNTGGVMGKFCGGTLPPVLISSDTMMTIKFVTDSSITREGFTATYVTMDAGRLCGGYLHTTTGIIKSPNYPKNYLHDKDCVWVIQVPAGQQIMLNVTEFKLEEHQNCNFDYLEIRNGGTKTSPLIGKYCGEDIPRAIPSLGNQMYLRFASDTSRSEKGFYIFYDGTATGCGGLLNAPSGSITSPNYPSPYARNAECAWHIAISQGSKIQLLFVDFDLEAHHTCRMDYLEVRDGRDMSGKLIGKYCNTHPLSVSATGNHLYLRFRSDSSVESRGFHLKYETICTTTVTGFRGVIESPNFPEPYPGGRDCTWTISAPMGNKVNITFSHFATEVADTDAMESTATPAQDVCSYDYIQITESDSITPNVQDPILGRFCGTELPPAIYSSKAKVFIHFVSDALVADIGFRLEWVINGCGGHLHKPSGKFTSPNYPAAHPLSNVCEWIIETEVGQSVQLNITDMNLERGREDCSFDSLSIYSGTDNTSELMVRLCQTSLKNKLITSSGNVMFVRFVSDWSFSGRGFAAEYTTVNTHCGGKMTSPKGTFHSLNYPKNYGSNDSCWWLIEVDQNHLINLWILDFDVEDHSNCSADYFRIYDGNSTSSEKLLDHCGRDLPGKSKFQSTTNQLLVHFHTDNSVTAKGFKANYSIACGAKIVTDSSGLIGIIDDINGIENNQNCSWIIAGTKPDDHVSLTITHMDVSPNDDNEDGCRAYYVEVLDGESTDSPSIGGHYCGTLAPPTLVSSGNAMVVQLVSDHGLHIGNFEATYTVLSSACGGNLTSERGVFVTPNYPGNYPANVECVWTINTSPGNRAQISFSDFNLVQTESCNEDYVEIRETDALGKLIGVYCSDLPGNVTASNSLWVKFRAGSAATTAKGFQASYTLVHGNELSGEQGQIASPLYPRSYVQTGEFTWRITVQFGSAIAITFKDFYIDKMVMECMSYLGVYDGFDETAPELLKACGAVLPEPVTSSSNVVYVKLETDPMRQGTVFLLDWLQVAKNISVAENRRPNVTGCGGLVQLNHVNGTPDVYKLTSPGFPGGYAGRLDCEWIFETIPGFHVAMTVSVMDLESSQTCSYDKVQVYRGRRNKPDWRLVSTLCWPNASTSDVIHTSLLMRVVFHTDFYVNKTGFLATVYSVCGGLLTDPNGVIQSSNASIGNRYYTECQWNITVRPGRKISIKFTTLNISSSDSTSGCGDQYVLLKNGGSSESPLLGDGKYCGTTIPSVLETVGNRAYIKYRALKSAKAEFRLEYREVSMGCGGNLVLTGTMTSVTISSPNYPNIPPAHTECSWVVLAPGGERLHMDFLERFDLTRTWDCSTAAVEVRDGGTQSSRMLGRYCLTMPSSIQTTGNIVHVRFFTDASDPKNGFKANISLARCGGTIRARRGSISSPNYPSPYPPNIDCQWRIVGFPGHSLTLDLQPIDLNAHRLKGCSMSDHLNVSEVVPSGNSTGEDVNLIQTFCTESRGFVRTSGNEAMVSFHSGPSSGRMTHYSGFRLVFNSSIDECGGSLETPSGVIQSLGYPTSYHNKYCRWEITVPKGRRITVKLLDFDLEPMGAVVGFGVPKLSFYNEFRFYSFITSYTSGSVPLPVKSTSNLMMMVLWGSHSTSSHRGFKATYTSDEPAVCGGDLSNATSPGYITLPSAALNLSSFYCIWEYYRPANLNQTFTITLVNGSVGNYDSKGCRVSQSWLIVTTQDDTQRLVRWCGNVTTPVIVNSPYPGTKFKALEWKSDVSPVYFTAKYSTSPCGGVLSGPEDVVSSPGDPNYPPNTDCGWAVTYPSGQAIQIRFTKFDLENSPNCDRDYVSIRNGPLPTSPVIGRYCGTEVPKDIQSQSNAIWIDFHSDSANQRIGFSLILRPAVGGCGGTYQSDNGDIFSPNFPKLYPNNAECEWEIRVGNGYSLQLKIVDRFFVEESKNCTKDFIEVFDWVNNGWSSLGKACGRVAPPPFNATGNQMRVLFRSDSNGQGDGFKAQWGVKCGGIISDSQRGQIISPGYPLHYDSDLTCNYTILAPNKYISTSFEAFALEQGNKVAKDCRYDNVTLYGFANSWTRVVTALGTYCGNEAPPTRSFKNMLSLVFQTDQFLERRGFLMKYEISTCGGEITSPGDIQSPGENEGYSGNVNCTWSITAPANQAVVLRFSRLELEHSYQCHYDTVSVYEGTWTDNDKLVSQYCGNLSSSPPVAKVESNQMLVNYRVAHQRSKYLFSASIVFTYGEKVGCGGKKNITTSNTLLRSPDVNGDGKYEHFLDCHWLLSAPAGQTIKLAFTTLSLAPCYNTTLNNTSDCTCDFVEIRDGMSQFADLIGRYCKDRPSAPIISSSNQLWVRFVSDDNGNGVGFQATVSSVPSICGTTALNVTDAPQVLTSPGYPGNYPTNVRCRWLLTSSQPLRFDIHFEDIDIDETENCAADSLVITDIGRVQVISQGLGKKQIQYGNPDRPISIGRGSRFPTSPVQFCGKPRPIDFYSESNSVAVTFTSDQEKTAKGFKIIFNNAGCTRNFTAVQGRILVEHIPTHCFITITAPVNHTISVYFTSFVIFSSVDCASKALEIRDGADASGAVLTKVCGYEVPRPVFSTGRNLYLHIWKEDVTDYEHFDITFTTTDKGRGCGGPIFNYGGTFASPFYPNNYRNFGVCRWDISVPTGTLPILKFEVFDIGPQTTCSTDFVEMIDVDPVTQVEYVRARYCGQDTPAMFMGTTETVAVRYTTSVNNGGTGWLIKFMARQPGASISIF